MQNSQLQEYYMCDAELLPDGYSGYSTTPLKLAFDTSTRLSPSDREKHT